MTNETEAGLSDHSDEKDVFVDLLQAIEKQLKKQVRSITQTPISCDDVFQEAILEAWKGFKQLRDKKCFGHWIFMIALRKYRQMLKAILQERNRRKKYMEKNEEKYRSQFKLPQNYDDIDE